MNELIKMLLKTVKVGRIMQDPISGEITSIIDKGTKPVKLVQSEDKQNKYNITGLVNPFINLFNPNEYLFFVSFAKGFKYSDYLKLTDEGLRIEYGSTSNLRFSKKRLWFGYTKRKFKLQIPDSLMIYYLIDYEGIKLDKTLHRMILTKFYMKYEKEFSEVNISLKQFLQQHLTNGYE